MRFTVEPEPLIKIVSMVGEWAPGRKNAGPPLRMVASAGRVRVESRREAAEIDAAVWEDGQCTLSQAKLLAALKPYREQTDVTIQGDERGLRVGERSMSVLSYQPQTAAPKAFQIFLATDSGVVASRFTPVLEPAAGS